MSDWPPPPHPDTLAGAFGTSAERQRILRAFEVADRAHAGQARDEGAPYIVHPLRVAGEVLFGLARQDADMVCAALLHDVIEDSNLAADDLRPWFGDWIADAVLRLSKERVGPELNKAERDRRYYARLAEAERRVLLIKLCDRLDNLRGLHLSPDEEKKGRYRTQTEHLLAVVLGAPSMAGADEVHAYFSPRYAAAGVPWPA